MNFFFNTTGRIEDFDNLDQNNCPKNSKDNDYDSYDNKKDIGDEYFVHSVSIAYLLAIFARIL